MSWETLWKAVLGVVAGFGGISGIFVIAIKFSSNFIAEKLSKKYELKLSKELENYKYNLENKNYISKARFDTEFNIYRELSKAFFDMVKDITTMIPIGVATYPADEEKRKEYEHNLYVAASKSTVNAQDVLNSNAPFIPEAFFSKYNNILANCKVQLRTFERRWNVLILSTKEEKETFRDKDYRLSDKIYEDYNSLSSEIREYLTKLDVLE